jgi:hypothetical protein
MCLFFDVLSDLFFFPGPSAYAEFKRMRAAGKIKCFIV